MCRSFLWASNIDSRKANVAWKDVCFPKREGGLGIKDLAIWNKAAIGKNIWQVFSNKDSLWATWITKTKLKRLSFREITENTQSSWSWSKILSLRGIFKPLFQYKLSNGNVFSFWYDPWLNGISQNDSFPNINLKNAEIDKKAYVTDLWKRGSWKLPSPINSDMDKAWDIVKTHCLQPWDDSICWLDGESNSYSIQLAWNTLRIKKPKVSWANIVWNNQIKKHSFVMWLALKGKLAIKDRISKWKPGLNSICSLYGLSAMTIERANRI